MKYGFRFVTREEWGLLRGSSAARSGSRSSARRSAGSRCSCSRRSRRPRMTSALIVASLIPLGQSLEGLAGSALYLRNRYDIRAGFLTWSMALRLVGVAIGAQYGLVEAVAGVLVAQVIATASVGVVGRLAFRSLPARRRGQARRAAARDLHLRRAVERGDRRPLVARRARAAAARGRHDARRRSGIFKIAQAPQSGLPGAVGAGADGAAHRADARVGARPPVRGAPAGAPLQPDRRARCAGRRAAAALGDAASDLARCTARGGSTRRTRRGCSSSRRRCSSSSAGRSRSR